MPSVTVPGGSARDLRRRQRPDVEQDAAGHGRARRDDLRAGVAVGGIRHQRSGPAPDSISTLAPAATSFRTLSGVAATRLSPGDRSARTRTTTPTVPHSRRDGVVAALPES